MKVKEDSEKVGLKLNIQKMKIIFVQFFCVFLPPLLNIFCFCLSFFVPIFAWNVPLVFLIFLKRSLVFPHSIVFLYFFALITEEVIYF